MTQVQQTSEEELQNSDKIPEKTTTNNNFGETAINESKIKFEDWGFKVDRLFEVAYRFYKRNESKAFHPSFDVRNRLNALILQARYGNLDNQKTPDIGFLDLVGKNRRNQWSLLKGMSRTEAMSEFICTLDELCPFFKAHAEAVCLCIEEGAGGETKDGNIPTNDSNSGHASQQDASEQLDSIQTSLCRQTYKQFKNYAEKQYPGDSNKQKQLITSLQEQYCRQYISQMHPELNLSDYKSKPTSRTPELVDASRESSPKNECDQQNTPLTLNESDLRCDEHSSVSSKLPQNGSTHIAVDIYPSNEAIYNGQYTSSLVDQSSDKKPSFDSSYNQPPPISFDSNIDLQNIGKFESYPEPKPLQRNAAREKASTSGPNLKEHSHQPTTSIHGKANESRPTLSIKQPPDQLPPTPPLELPPLQQLELPPPKLESPIPDSQSEPINMTQEELSTDLSTNNVCMGETSTTEFHHQRVEATWSCSSSSEAEDSPLQQSISYEPLEPASIWTKKGVNEFKDSLIDDKHGGAYIVKQGTLLTIQVPTYPEGKYIYFEFATEDYDIGFGMDFLYDSNLRTPLALKIYEETDEDEDDIEELDLANNEFGDGTNRVEEGRRDEIFRKRAEKYARAANTISIVPTYRRDSHEEVFVGRHKYPGQGYYLLKFDNTYSVLRSKSLFFRVCYFI